MSEVNVLNVSIVLKGDGEDAAVRAVFDGTTEPPAMMQSIRALHPFMPPQISTRTANGFAITELSILNRLRAVVFDGKDVTILPGDYDIDSHVLTIHCEEGRVNVNNNESQQQQGEAAKRKGKSTAIPSSLLWKLNAVVKMTMSSHWPTIARGGKCDMGCPPSDRACKW